MTRKVGVFHRIVATLRFLASVMRYIQRARNRGRRRPQLILQHIHPPYWGGTCLEVAVRNIGPVAAKDCRYCRLQRFTMDGPAGAPPAMIVRRWYATDLFAAPAQSTVKSKAVLTASACPHQVLQDIPEPRGQEDSWRDAIICRDASGTVYRFRMDLGPDAIPDIWSPGPFDGALRRPPPSWAGWVANTRPVERAEWT